MDKKSIDALYAVLKPPASPAPATPASRPSYAAWSPT